MDPLSRYGVLYDSAESFFSLSGSSVMVLTREAAVEVCRQAAGRGFVVAGYDCGRWRASGFQPDMNHGWSAKQALIESRAFEQNNELAARSIQEDDQAEYDAFVITIRRLP